MIIDIATASTSVVTIAAASTTFANKSAAIAIIEVIDSLFIKLSI